MKDTEAFEERKAVYTSEDIRFTMKDSNLYAIVLGWPEKETVIKEIPCCFREEEIKADTQCFSVYLPLFYFCIIMEAMTF